MGWWYMSERKGKRRGEREAAVRDKSFFKVLGKSL